MEEHARAKRDKYTSTSMSLQKLEDYELSNEVRKGLNTSNDSSKKASSSSVQSSSKHKVELFPPFTPLSAASMPAVHNQVGLSSRTMLLTAHSENRMMEQGSAAGQESFYSPELGLFVQSRLLDGRCEQECQFVPSDGQHTARQEMPLEKLGFSHFVTPPEPMSPASTVNHAAMRLIDNGTILRKGASVTLTCIFTNVTTP
jgi:hypothetical protein